MRDIYGLSPFNVEPAAFDALDAAAAVDLTVAPMSGAGEWSMPNPSRRLATGLSTFVVSLAAIGGPAAAFASGGSSHSKDAAPAVTTTTSTADCDVTPDFGVQSANTQFGTSDSAFPALYTVGPNGNHNLLPTDQAQTKIKDQLATDDRVLGYFTAFVTQPRNPQTPSLPNARTFDQAKTIIKGYETNPDNRTNDLAAACAAVDFIKPVTNFPVLSNQAEEIAFNHNNQPTMTGVNMQTISSNEVLQGYEVGYNPDNSALTSQEQAVLQQEQTLFLITADGRMIIDKIVGPGSFQIAHNQNKAPVTPEKGTNQVPASASHETTQATGGGSQNQGQSNVGQSQHGRSGGGGSSSRGPAHQNQPGTSVGPRPNGPPTATPNVPHPSPAIGNNTPSTPSSPSQPGTPNKPVPSPTPPGPEQPPAPTPPTPKPPTPKPPVTPPTPKPPVTPPTPKPPVTPPTPTPPTPTPPTPTPPPPSTQKSGDTTPSNNGGQDPGTNPNQGDPII